MALYIGRLCVVGDLYTTNMPGIAKLYECFDTILRPRQCVGDNVWTLETFDSGLVLNRVWKWNLKKIESFHNIDNVHQKFTKSPHESKDNLSFKIVQQWPPLMILMLSLSHKSFTMVGPQVYSIDIRASLPRALKRKRKQNHDSQPQNQLIFQPSVWS